MSESIRQQCAHQFSPLWEWGKQLAPCDFNCGERVIIDMHEPQNERHPNWQPVEPGQVIPAGQPYRVVYANGIDYAQDAGGSTDGTYVEVDSSWRPPLELPTEPTWGWCVFTAVVGHNSGQRRVVGGHWFIQGHIPKGHYDATMEVLKDAEAKLALPCGSCHPCVEWAAETWRRTDGPLPVKVFVDQAFARAEKAESRVAHLEAGIKALADEWDDGYNLKYTAAWHLRALLNGTDKDNE